LSDFGTLTKVFLVKSPVAARIDDCLLLFFLYHRTTSLGLSEALFWFFPIGKTKKSGNGRRKSCPQKKESRIKSKEQNWF